MVPETNRRTRSVPSFSASTSLVPLLAPERKGIVPVRSHVIDPLLHRQDKKYDKVDEEDGPEDRHIEKRKERQSQGDDNSFGARVPEFEFGKLSNDGFELVNL